MVYDCSHVGGLRTHELQLCTHTLHPKFISDFPVAAAVSAQSAEKDCILSLFEDLVQELSQVSDITPQVRYIMGPYLRQSAHG